jgi:hypothetical protein
MDYPVSLSELAAGLPAVVVARGDAGRVVAEVEAVDWSRSRLDVSNGRDREFAARGVAVGAAVVHAFGNIYGLTFRPDREVMRSVNAAKGRPVDQVASLYPPQRVIEGLDRIGRHALFDVDRLPAGMSIEQLLEMMRALYEAGPFGFRGLATPDVGPHLTSPLTTRDGEALRAVQIIAPGYRDVWSAALVDRAVELAGVPVLAVTSANRSHLLTGRVEEPAHYRIAGIQNDFAGVRFPFVMLAHPDETMVPDGYPHHAQTSTSVVSFCPDPAVDRCHAGGRPTVVLARHGSLPADRVREILDGLHIDLHIPAVHARQLHPRTYMDRGAPLVPAQGLEPRTSPGGRR